MSFIKFQNVLFEFFFKRFLKKWIKEEFVPNDYKLFLNCNEIKEWGKQSNSFFEILNNSMRNLQASNDELFVLKSFDYYMGYVGKRMNNLLRGISSYQDNDSLYEYIGVIEKTINNYQINEPVVVLRRTIACLFDKQPRGTVFTEYGFLSTSLNLSYRDDSDGKKTLFANEALLVLKIPQNTKAMYVEEVQEERRRRNENELLIQKGSKLIIEKNIRILSNRIILATVFQDNCL